MRQAYVLVLYMYYFITYLKQTHELGIFVTPLKIYLYQRGTYHC